MALHPCPVCGKMISEKAVRCPKCGADLSQAVSPSSNGATSAPETPKQNAESQAETSLSKTKRPPIPQVRRSDENLSQSRPSSPQRQPSRKSPKQSGNNRSIQILAVTGVVVVVGVIAAYLYFSNKAENERIAELERIRLEQARQDSIAAEKARIEAMRKDSIAWVNFTTPDLAFNEVHGHVKSIVNNGIKSKYNIGVIKFQYNKDGVVEQEPQSKSQKYILKRNSTNEIVAMTEKYRNYFGYNGNCYDRWGYEYTWENGKVYSCIEQLIEADEIGEFGPSIYPLKYIYTDEGLLKEVHGTDQEGEGCEIIANYKRTYSDYKFDEFGNWISRRCKESYINGQGYLIEGGGYYLDDNDSDSFKEEESIETREITYYDNPYTIASGSYMASADFSRRFSGKIATVPTTMFVSTSETGWLKYSTAGSDTFKLKVLDYNPQTGYLELQESYKGTISGIISGYYKNGKYTGKYNRLVDGVEFQISFTAE